MKNFFPKIATAALLLSLAFSLRAQEKNPPAPSTPVALAAAPADREFEALRAGAGFTPPAQFGAFSAQERHHWMDVMMQKLVADGVAFYEKYPTDPRRWEIVTSLAIVNPPFVKTYGANFATLGMKDVVVDEPARAAWQAKQAALLQARSVATDLPPSVAEEEDYGKIEKDFLADARIASTGQPVDWSVYRARFDAHAAKYSRLGKTLVARAEDYLDGLNQLAPGAAATEWAHLRDASACAELREHAAGKARDMAWVNKPIAMAFIGLDGRFFDLALLRGKVVLLDFWATHVKVSVTELTRLKELYATYHDKGFEVVGLALEDPHFAGDDTAERKARKLEQTKRALRIFGAVNALPWPQYFDDKAPQNQFADIFSIRSIPTTFLLNPEGNIVATNLHGPELEKQIRRLLKL